MQSGGGKMVRAESAGKPIRRYAVTEAGVPSQALGVLPATTDRAMEANRADFSAEGGTRLAPGEVTCRIHNAGASQVPFERRAGDGRPPEVKRNLQ